MNRSPASAEVLREQHSLEIVSAWRIASYRRVNPFTGHGLTGDAGQDSVVAGWSHVRHPTVKRQGRPHRLATFERGEQGRLLKIRLEPLRWNPVRRFRDRMEVHARHPDVAVVNEERRSPWRIRSSRGVGHPVPGITVLALDQLDNPNLGVVAELPNE